MEELEYVMTPDGYGVVIDMASPSCAMSEEEAVVYTPVAGNRCYTFDELCATGEVANDLCEAIRRIQKNEKHNTEH